MICSPTCVSKKTCWLKNHESWVGKGCNLWYFDGCIEIDMTKVSLAKGNSSTTLLYWPNSRIIETSDWRYIVGEACLCRFFVCLGSTWNWDHPGYWAWVTCTSQYFSLAIKTRTAQCPSIRSLTGKAYIRNSILRKYSCCLAWMCLQHIRKIGTAAFNAPGKGDLQAPARHSQIFCKMNTFVSHLIYN